MLFSLYDFDPSFAEPNAPPKVLCEKHYALFCGCDFIGEIVSPSIEMIDGRAPIVLPEIIDNINHLGG